MSSAGEAGPPPCYGSASMCPAPGHRSLGPPAPPGTGTERAPGTAGMRGADPRHGTAGKGPAAGNKRRKEGEGSGAAEGAPGKGGEGRPAAATPPGSAPRAGEKPGRVPGRREGGRGWGRGTPAGEGDRPGERRSPFWNLPAGGLWGPRREQPGGARRRARHKAAEGKQARAARRQGRPEGGGQGGWAPGVG